MMISQVALKTFEQFPHSFLGAAGEEALPWKLSMVLKTIDPHTVRLQSYLLKVADQHFDLKEERTPPNDFQYQM
jgi:hypothetical protein